MWDLVGNPEDRFSHNKAQLSKGSVPESSDAAIDRTKQKQLQTTVNNIVTTLRKDAKRGDLNLEVEGKTMELTDMSFDEDPVFVCEPGSVLKDQSCGGYLRVMP